MRIIIYIIVSYFLHNIIRIIYIYIYMYVCMYVCVCARARVCVCVCVCVCVFNQVTFPTMTLKENINILFHISSESINTVASYIGEGKFKNKIKFKISRNIYIRSWKKNDVFILANQLYTKINSYEKE